MSGELPPEAPDLSATQYQLEKLLGQGGFGQAYLAFNRGLRRRCVLKVLTDINNAGFVARFYREAQVMANLEHPTIPRVYEVATTKAGQPFFVMEYIDGKSLGEHLADEGGTLPLPEACRLIADAAEGLAAAHDMGVVHRDVKLANLLVNKRGSLKVIDFGIAKKTIEDAEKTAGILTRVGELFGTPRYMSPEQAMAKPLGPPSDLYSLGVVLFVLLTGRSPFDGTPHEMMTGHVKVPAPKLAELSGHAFPPAIEALVARLLAKDPEARFANGNELAAALRAAGGVAQAVTTTQPSWPTPSPATSFAARDALTASRVPAPPAPPSPQPPIARPSVSRSTDLRLAEAVRQAMVTEPSIAVTPIAEFNAPTEVQAINLAVRGFRPDDYAQTELALPAITQSSGASTQVYEQPISSPPVRPASETSDGVVMRPAQDAAPIVAARPRVEQVGRHETTPSALQTFVGQPNATSRTRAPMFIGIALVCVLGLTGAFVALWPRGGVTTTTPKETTTPSSSVSDPVVPPGPSTPPTPTETEPLPTVTPTPATPPTALPTASSKPPAATATAKPIVVPTVKPVAPPPTKTVAKPTATTTAAPPPPPKPSGKVLDDDRT